MDETIGVKGGYNDRKRMLRISNKQKEKLRELQEEKEIKDLEQKVRKQQIYTLIKTLPIAIGGGAFKVIYDVGTGKKDVDKQEEYSKWRIKEYGTDMSTKSRQEEEFEKKMRKKTIVQPDGRKIVILIPVEEPKKTFEHPIVEELEIEEKNKENKDIEEKNKKIKEERKLEIEENKVKKEKKLEEIKKEKEKIKDEKKQEKEKEIKKSINQKGDKESPEVIDVVNIDKSKKEDRFVIDNLSKKISKGSDINIEELSPEAREKLDKLKARKIIDEYEKQLKEIRYEMRQLIYEYNVLVDEEANALTTKELENILDRLSDVIWKVEQLKNKIQIDNLDKYDDNYIYTLIEDYLLEFKDKRVISEIKESPLYILISEKLDELDHRKDELKDKVNYKKEVLAEKEEDFDKLKEKYYSIDKINKNLLDFQKEQEAYLKEIQEKIDNAVTVNERVQVEIEAMSRQSRRLLRRLTMAMLFPGSRAATGLALTTTAYIHYARQLMNPRTVTRRYRVVNVTDYSRDIEYSIKSIDDAIGMLGKTDQQLDRLISQIKEEFKDYFGVFKEFDELLSNLERVKKDLNEKEYEMQKIKDKQEKELERNNAKVLTRGEYPM